MQNKKKKEWLETQKKNTVIQELMVCTFPNFTQFHHKLDLLNTSLSDRKVTLIAEKPKMKLLFHS